jgi:deazaflavin-dependent oxidoreductase (nitroreductase family)
MTSAPDLSRYARRKTVRLTTVGRRSGQKRTVTIWFVVEGPASILVQHVAKKPANWYRNLAADPTVEIDFGDGPLPARAQILEDRREVDRVVSQIGKKYWSYRLIRLFGGGADTAVAARIITVA